MVNAEYVDDPLHVVRIDSFYLDKYEVTNAQYLEFCPATGHRLPEFWGMQLFCSRAEFPDHPVTGVSCRSLEILAPDSETGEMYSRINL